MSRIAFVGVALALLAPSWGCEIGLPITGRPCAADADCEGGVPHFCQLHEEPNVCLPGEQLEDPDDRPPVMARGVIVALLGQTVTGTFTAVDPEGTTVSFEATQYTQGNIGVLTVETDGSWTFDAVTQPPAGGFATQVFDVVFADEAGTQGSGPVFAALVDDSAGSGLSVWNGVTSEAWEVETNWTPGDVVPDATSGVLLPGGTPNQPAITDTAAVRRAFVGHAADLQAGTLEIVGDQLISASTGHVDGTMFHLLGTSPFVAGELSALVVEDGALLQGATATTGDVTLAGAAGAAPFEIGAATLTVGGSLSDNGGVRLAMSDPGSALIVEGALELGGMALVTEGTITLRGDLLLNDRVRVGADVDLYFAGDQEQRIRVPDAQSWLDHAIEEQGARLRVETPVRFLSSLDLRGHLQVDDGATIYVDGTLILRSTFTSETVEQGDVFAAACKVAPNLALPDHVHCNEPPPPPPDAGAGGGDGGGVVDGGGGDAGGGGDGGGFEDAGAVDGGESDAGDADAGGADAGDADAGPPNDAGGDAGSPVDGGVDAGAPDGGFDAGLPFDGGYDAGFDAGLDAGGPFDGGYDAGFDGGFDAGGPFDGGYDAGFDGGFDAGGPFDGGYDAGFDAGFDGGFDGGFDAGAGFDGGVDSGILVEDAGPPPAPSCPAPLDRSTALTHNLIIGAARQGDVSGQLDLDLNDAFDFQPLYGGIGDATLVVASDGTYTFTPGAVDADQEVGIDVNTIAGVETACLRLVTVDPLDVDIFVGPGADWGTGANWSSGTGPSGSDAAYIPSGALVTVTSNVSAGLLYVEADATVLVSDDVTGPRLGLASAFVAGHLAGNGSVSLTQDMAGRIDNPVCSGPLTAIAAVSADSLLTGGTQCELTLGSERVTLSGGVSALTMSIDHGTAASMLDVGGSLAINALSGNMAVGRWRVGGDISLGTAGPTGGHVTELVGSAAQSLQVVSLGDVEALVGGGAVNFTNGGSLSQFTTARTTEVLSGSLQPLAITLEPGFSTSSGSSILPGVCQDNTGDPTDWCNDVIGQ